MTVKRNPRTGETLVSQQRRQCAERYSRFRDAARARCRGSNVTVSEFANVHPVEGGAFVDAVVFVRDSDLEP